MKTTLLLITLLFSSLSMAQEMNDTLYFNSGEIRLANVVKETKSAISYQYEKNNGKTSSGRMRKSMLYGYAIYNENQQLTSRHMNERRKQSEEDPNSVAKDVGIVVGGISVAALAVTGVVVAGGIILINWLSNGGG